MKLTSIIVTTIVICLGIYDLWAVTFGGVDSTISRFLQGAAFRSPVFTFAVGFVCGHIFGYMKPVGKS